MDSAAKPPGPVPRTPKEEVRRRLLAAAVQVFAEHGYAEARLEDIAHVAGFTKGAVYSNFGSKRELFGAVLSLGAGIELGEVTTRIGEADDPRTAVQQAAEVVAARIVNDPERGRLGLEFAARAVRDDQTRSTLAPLRRAQREGVAALVSEVAQRGGVRDDIDPQIAALVLHCLTNGLSMEHLADPESITADKVEQALKAVLTAFGSTSH